MGFLVAKKYPTKLFLGAADHTYVECGTGGKAWKCFGGKLGGVRFNGGVGSTMQADAIAGLNEQAGIACYLVNGVCHQAANRILYPAGILVSGARGYGLSQAIFGPYGRASAGPCHANFNQHPNITGDLPECLRQGGDVVGSGSIRIVANQHSSDRSTPNIRRISKLYNLLNAKEPSPEDAKSFNLQVFMEGLKLTFRDSLSNISLKRLRHAKTAAEDMHHAITLEWTTGHMSASEFVTEFNGLTIQFQDLCAEDLNANEYQDMFDLPPTERIRLADPQALDFAFGEGTARAVYGDLPSPTD